MINNNKAEEEKEANDSLRDKLHEYFFLTKGMDSDKLNKINTYMVEYINRFYRNVTIDNLDEEVFERMIIQFIPMRILDVTGNEINEFFNEWNFFLDFIKKFYNINIVDSYKKIYKKNYNELKRINYISKEIRKYSEEPVLLWEPLVIDYNCYIKFKRNKEIANKHVVYDQGYYRVYEMIGEHVILKKIGSGDFYKIKLDLILIAEIRKNDIIHMLLRRKIFCSSWEIIKVKGYYDQKVGKYLNVGGTYEREAD